MLAVVFNLSHDVLEELPLVADRKITRVERLNANAERVPCHFTDEGNGKITVNETVLTLDPTVLFLS